MVSVREMSVWTKMEGRKVLPFCKICMLEPWWDLRAYLTGGGDSVRLQHQQSGTAPTGGEVVNSTDGREGMPDAAAEEGGGSASEGVEEMVESAMGEEEESSDGGD